MQNDDVSHAAVRRDVREELFQSMNAARRSAQSDNQKLCARAPKLFFSAEQIAVINNVAHSRSCSL
jgi:hypothetical protein